MANLLDRLGVCPPRPGQPLTESELRRNARALKVLNLMALMTFSIAMAAFPTTFVLYQCIPFSLLPILLTITVVFYGLFVYTVRLLDPCDANGWACGSSLQPLTPKQCLQMSGWSSDYSEIREYVARVNAQGRPIYEADLRILQSQVDRWQQEAQACKGRKACVELHSLTL